MNLSLLYSDIWTTTWQCYNSAAKKCDNPGEITRNPVSKHQQTKDGPELEEEAPMMIVRFDGSKVEIKKMMKQMEDVVSTVHIVCQIAPVLVYIILFYIQSV